MTFKFKLAGAFAALALAAGMVPGAVSSVAAFEIKGQGQHFEKPPFPRWPHIIALGGGLAALTAAILVLSEKENEPVSP